jgi:ribosomal-protein-alanine N-acetyltransferase
MGQRGRKGAAMAPARTAFPELTTTRLRLRQFEPRDVDGLHACFGDADAMRYWTFPACKTKAETERWVRILAKTSNPHEYLAWAVADKRADRCIGMVIYHHREVRNHRLEIGYILGRAQRGRGLMTEALQALLAYCFEQLGVHRVDALIHPDNVPSIRLAERLGFRLEGGPVRDYWRVGDAYASVMVYGLIAGEEAWARVPRAAAVARRGRR